MKQEKKEILLSARTRYQTIVDIIDDVLENENEAGACRKHNLHQTVFRFYVNNKAFTNGMPIKEQNKIWLEPYQRLYCDVLEIEGFTIEQVATLPVDFNETVGKLIKELTRRGLRMKDVVCLYYFEEMNYTEIAKYFSLSKTRIRDIHQKFLRIMRHSKNKVRLMYGDKMLAKIKKSQRLHQKRVFAIIEEMEEIQRKLDEQQKEKERIEAQNRKREEEQKEKYKSMGIRELTKHMKLKSARAYQSIIFDYNCRDSDNTSAYEYLLSLNSIDKILDIPSVGVKTAEEIACALEETFGIEVIK